VPLGVSIDLIAEDYALSGQAMVTMLTWLRQEHPDARHTLARLAPAVVSAPRSSMAAFLDGVLDRYGSFDSLADDLGVSESVKRLRRALLEDAHE
jgi:Tyrosine phosphatase family